MDEWNLMRFEATSKVCDAKNDPNAFRNVQKQNQYSPTCAQCGGMGYTLPRKSRLIGSQNTWSRKWFATESLYSADMRREYCSRATFLANLLSRTNLFFSCKSSVLRNEWYRQWEVRCIELIKPMYKISHNSMKISIMVPHRQKFIQPASKHFPQQRVKWKEMMKASNRT